MVSSHSRQQTDPKFAFVDVNELTVFSDNVLPAVLRKVCCNHIWSPQSHTHTHKARERERRELTHFASAGYTGILRVPCGAYRQRSRVACGYLLSLFCPISATHFVGEQEVELRAVAVHACERIIQTANEMQRFPSPINAMLLDYYLW